MNVIPIHNIIFHGTKTAEDYTVRVVVFEFSIEPNNSSPDSDDNCDCFIENIALTWDC